MKKIIFAVMTFSLISFANASNEAPKENRLTCAHTTMPLTLIVDLKNGSTKVVDNENGGFLVSETFQVKRSKKNVELSQTQNKDLPLIVLQAAIDSNGAITATSFDDLAGGTSQYKCVLTK